MNSIITLTTDFGLKDHFVGAMKGKLLSESRDFQIVDITHQIDLFNIVEAAYVIGSSYHYFPKDTVHFIGVDSEKTAFSKHVVMYWHGHYFVAADNGILSFLTHRYNPDKIIEITVHNLFPPHTSSTDIMLTVAAHLAKGGAMDVIGKEIKSLKEIVNIQPIVQNDERLNGSVVYIDHFGNCITNITKQLIKEVGRGRAYTVTFGTKKIKRIHKTYSDFNAVDEATLRGFEGEALAKFNSQGYLEIAIYKSNPKTVGAAKSLFGLNISSTVTINFI